MTKRTLTATEKQVIVRYFTIEDASVLESDDAIRVYCRRDCLPMSIWPFLIGGYSRSAEPLAIRWLLAIQNADPEHYERNLLKLIDASIDNGILDEIYARVEKFLATWAVAYGHASLKDSALDCFAVECISQRATKSIEDSALAAYQEKSTRYMDFSDPNFCFNDCDNTLKPLYDRAMALYEKTTAHAMRYYEDLYRGQEFVSETAKRNTIKAKCFDTARYLLPTGIRTSLGVTCSTRETERLIQRMLAEELPEVNEIAEKMLEHGKKINPGLLKHVTMNPYSVRRVRGLNEHEDLALHGPELQDVESNIETKLVHVNREDTIKNLMLALTYLTSPVSAGNLLTRLNSVDQGLFASLLDKALAERGPHDEFPIEFKQGQLVFEIILDFGAFRDLQRHRIGTQIIHGFDPFTGWTTPEVIEHNEELNAEFQALMQDFSDTAALLDHPDYCMTMAHNVRYLYMCDIKQFAYLVELRTGPAGHWSYRRVCQKMAREFLDVFPEFEPYLRIDWSGYTDRSHAENNTALKLSQLP